MLPTSDLPFSGDVASLQRLVDEPEDVSLRRLARLVEHLYRVPVAYFALLDLEMRVGTRIGSGSEVWHYLKTFPLAPCLAGPQVVRDATKPGAVDWNSGNLGFAAGVPLRSSDGMVLGVLVIADWAPRPDFSDEDLATLAELAGVLAGKMELRMIASQVIASEFTLRETQGRFRAIANSAPVLIFYAGPDGGCSFVNQTWRDFTGRTLEEESGEGWMESVHPEYRQGVQERYWQAFDERKPCSCEFRLRRHDGTYRWMLGRGIPRFLGDGTFAGFISGITDVTEFRESAQAVRKQTQCTIALAQAAGLDYALLDPDGHIRQAHPPPEDWRSRYLWEAWELPKAGVEESIRQAIAGRAPAKGEAGGRAWTISPITADPEEITVLVASMPHARC